MLHDDDDNDDDWHLKVVAAHIALELLPNILEPTMAVGNLRCWSQHRFAPWTPCRPGIIQSIMKCDDDICKDLGWNKVLANGPNNAASSN